jgi:hypothetical protein
MQLTFRESWTDPRLAYKHLSDGVDLPAFVILPSSGQQIWMPDTFFPV